MSEQDNSSSSDLIGLANFSLLDDDFDLDLIPTLKLFFQRKEERLAPVSGEDLHKKFVECVPKKTRENNQWAVKLLKKLVYAPEYNPGNICGKSIFFSTRRNFDG